MPKFIELNAKSAHENTARPAHVNIDQIAFVTTAGEFHDPDGHAVITFVGGLDKPNERLITQQTPAQVMALIEAALTAE